MSVGVKVLFLLGTAFLLFLAYLAACYAPFPIGAGIIAVDVVAIVAILRVALIDEWHTSWPGSVGEDEEYMKVLARGVLQEEEESEGTQGAAVEIAPEDKPLWKRILGL